jgi:hypothetical protein
MSNILFSKTFLWQEMMGIPVNHPHYYESMESNICYNLHENYQLLWLSD